MKRLLLLPILFLTQVAFGQWENGFPYGKINLNDLNLKVYAQDSTANAVILDEFGESYIDNANDHNLLHYYHVKIKILNSKGFDQANISIPLHRVSSGKKEVIHKLEAVTYNLENGRTVETILDPKKIFVENKNKYLDLMKFTFPNVKEGSVLEFRYRLESPFLFKFRGWEFQSDLPKVNTEYWARIPGNYLYNITLRGFYKLDKNESEIVKDCFAPGGGNKADCALNKYAMRHVPAFVEEDYMTAKSNFLSSINFELSEIHFFDGRKDRVTKEWKDVDQELRTHAGFGAQLRKGKDLFKENLIAALAAEPDSLKKAQAIYTYIKNWYTWNDFRGHTSDLGVKKAFDSKTGNVADINLSLVAALNYAGFQTDPMLLSTRANGTPIELHPVLSDFDYVIAKVRINQKDYLLDATDPFLAFGNIPMRCLNGKGRVIPAKGASYWMDIKPTAKQKKISVVNLTLQKEGHFVGQITNVTDGYDALGDRKRIRSFNNQDEYIESVDERWDKIKIKKYEISGLNQFDSSLRQVYHVEIEGFKDLNKNKLFLNPFVLGEWQKNPFTAKERLYPVDLGAPLETTLSVNLEYPAEFEVTNLPAPITIMLPNNGGKYLFSVQTLGNKIILNSMLFLNKPIYSSGEYHYLKELLNKVVQSHQSNLVFNRKS